MCYLSLSRTRKRSRKPDEINLRCHTVAEERPELCSLLHYSLDSP